MKTIKSTTYSAKGYVYGKMWGGGTGYYESKSFMNYKSLKPLFKDINKAFKNGSLDGGMGFETLIGAYMNIETKDTKGDWVRVKNQEMIVGKIDIVDLQDALGN